MILHRKAVTKIKMEDDTGDGFVHAQKDALFSMVWEITKDNWAFVRGQDVERRLQRDVANFVKRAS